VRTLLISRKKVMRREFNAGARFSAEGWCILQCA
jgi:hypothetical protein